MSSNIILQISNIKKECIKSSLKLLLLDNISFNVMEKSFTTLLAAQHSKKTLLLEIVAGLDYPTEGVVNKFNNNISYIPSGPSSLPWLNVKDNIKIAISNKKNNDSSIISEVINLTGLHGYEEHFPDNRSKGFRFRISLARALAAKPGIIVIDEPFQNMDHTSRIEMYTLLRSIFLKTGITIFFATSNISEAVFLSDRILIMDHRSSGIINELIITMPDPRDKKLLEDVQFKRKIEEIENLVKASEAQLFNSFLI